MVGLGATAAFVRRKRASRAHLEGRTGRHPAVADHGRDVSIELARAKEDSRWVMAVSDAGQKAENACGDRVGEQNGAGDLGHDDEEEGL